MTPATSWVHETGKFPVTQEPSELLHALLPSILVAEAGLSGAGQLSRFSGSRQQGSAVHLPLPNIMARGQLWGCCLGLPPAPSLVSSGLPWGSLLPSPKVSLSSL